MLPCTGVSNALPVHIVCYYNVMIGFKRDTPMLYKTNIIDLATPTCRDHAFL